MKDNFNTISRRLFLSFGILFLNIVLISVLGIVFIRSNNKLNELTKNADSQRISIAQLFKADLDFLRFAPINKSFYMANASINWGDNNHSFKYRHSLVMHLKEANQSLFKALIAEQLATAKHLSKVDSLLDNYDSTFIIITEKLKQRGFKDYGLEGVMRSYAHQLETSDSAIPMDKVLTLRRHEKDFFLRKEKIYIEKLNLLVDDIIRTQTASYKASTAVLKDYQDSFNQLTLLEQQIGLSPGEGLMGTLNAYTVQLSKELEDIATQSELKAALFEKESFAIVVVIGLLSIIISSFATYFTARKLTRPIKNLSSSMSKFLISDERINMDYSELNVPEEIQTLQESFVSLHKTLKNQFEEINQKSMLLGNQNIELKKLNEDLDRFIYSAAHDLKSPLSSLLGLINIAEVDLVTPGKEHYFKMMKSSVVKLESFIKDITDYARNKRQNLKIEKIDLEETIKDIVSDLHFLPNYDYIKQHFEIKGDAFYSDKTRFEIVLKNLISNAYRYSDGSKETPYIKIKSTITANYLAFVIEDNGIGIGNEHLSKIFNMFYRASEDSKGTGLGLFLVRESVKMLRGNIAVSSKLGESTTFRLKLPNLHKYNINTPESNPLELVEA